MKNRLKLLREELGVTQQKFADSVGISQNTYAKYEMGIRTPIKSIVDNICKTFGVNERWLRTGDGEMFAPKGDEIDEILRRNNIPEGFRGIAEIFFSLPEPAQKAFYDFAMAYIEKVKAKSKEDAKAEVRAEVEKELRAEMEAEKEDRERQAIHVLLDAQLDAQKGDKGSTLVSGGTKSKEV